MSLQIIKLSNKSWKHVDTIDGAFILTKFYAKTENDKFIIVEVYGSKRREYLASEITITDIGGSPEIFTNLEDLILRLEQLKYTGFYLDGEINPTDYDLEDFQNNSTDPFARISDIVGGGEWGSITGTLSDQTDLQDALDSKVDKVSTAGVERAYIINADGSQGTKATSDFGNTQNYFTFSTNTTLTNSHHNAVIWVTATINITIPSGLRSDFNCTFRTLTGAIATFLTSGTTINVESDGNVQAAKTMSYIAQYTTNVYIISGGGLS